MYKVFMTPSPDRVNGVNGIEQVCLKYGKYMPDFGYEYVNNVRECDLIATHAGSGQIVDGYPLVSHCHGLYFSNDYDSDQWQYKANAKVIESIRKSDEVTVPSAWVAETFKRDMRLSPHVIGHAVEIDEWQPQPHQGYVLWNKNRSGDVCFTDPIDQLARRYPNTLFAATFAPPNATPNINQIGTMPHHEMKEWIQQSCVYLSTTKETFGIGILEAMASGVPVLGFDFGGNSELVQHGINGYLARPDDYDDLAYGLNYCLVHRDTLGDNGREIAKQYNWRDVCEKVANVYHIALQPKPATASIIIPVYNKQEHETKRAIESAVSQTYAQLEHIIVIDDGSNNEDDVKRALESFDDKRIKFIRQNNQGVANTRNNGIAQVDSKYIACLDADDEMHPTMLEKLIPALEQDKALGVAYGGLSVRLADDSAKQSTWPGQCNFDDQLVRKNQVPTCCVFRRDAWERVGGYKQRYAPEGCGAEDAEFWLRLGAYGFGIEQATKEPLFLYSLGGQTMRKDYQEVDWTYWHPWTRDEQHPFASIATPKYMSHKVRQYDNPAISVVIPVGPGHEKDVINALDSLEAQTYRNWECIVVWDCAPDRNYIDWFSKAYPYVKQIYTHYGSRSVFQWPWHTPYALPSNSVGAGCARNQGVEISKGDFLVFLDADDWLYPEFMETCLEGWNEQQAIIYTDYVGKAIISHEHAEKLSDADRLKAFNNETGEAVIAHKSANYDCQMAQAQPAPTGDPNAPFYHWCLVTCLIPKAWHNEIGGFDENMPTWEDIDYHWRMARKGKCYTRVESELIVYNFHTGHRREKSHEMFKEIVSYVKEKYESEDLEMCKNCGSKIAPQINRTFSTYSNASTRAQQLSMMEKDADYVWCLYEGQPNNRGDHPLIGHITQTRYGYGHYGARVLVHRSDIWDSQGRMFGLFVPQPQKPKKVVVKKPVQQKQSVQLDAPKSLVDKKPLEKKASFDDLRQMANQDETPKDVTTNEVIDLQTIPGISSGIAKQLADRGIQSVDALWDFGIDGLSQLKYCNEEKAELIMEVVRDRYG